MSDTSPPKHAPRQHASRTLAEGDWLKLEEVEYTDHTGELRTWETTARQGKGGAVVMIARLRPSGAFLLIRQYRPPIDRFVLEFPAGLVDRGEEPEETAVRELREETGFRGTITWISPPTLSSPGMSREDVTMALMDVDTEALENQKPAQCCDENENIEVLVKTRDEIPELLRQCGEEGVRLDSRLVTFFLGMGVVW